ncbi:MAG: hypothetical protein HGB00_08725 [Chlorobiaceae bacterium]|nr:hypothetical protein [Chlorobiaceae bacterium]
MNINLRLLKVALLLASSGCFSSTAFCSGKVTGKISASLAKHNKGVVVYLKGGHEKIKTKTAIVEQKNLEFVPHVTAIPVGSTVSFVNRDKVNHDIFSSDRSKSLDINNSTPGVFKKVVFDTVGEVNLLCTIHPEMSGFIVVVDSNHYAVTGEDGKFSIRDVPAGRYDLVVWSEKLKKYEKKTVIVKDGRISNVVIGMER